MLVTGDADDTVNPANTSRMVHSLILAGKDFELVVLPGQRHGYMGLAKEYYFRKNVATFRANICWMNDK